MDDPQVPYANAPEEPQNKSQGVANKQTKLYKLLLMILAGVSAVPLIMVIIFGVRAFINDDMLNKANQKGQQEGAAAQKKSDEEKFAKIQNSDFKTFTAPDSAGNFKVDTPKSWSLAVTPDDGGNTISAIAMPDFVDTKLAQFALRYALVNKNTDDIKKPFDTLAQEKNLAKRKVTATEETVSGIKAFRYTGQLSSKIPNGTIIFVPMRDKTFSIQTDDNTKYLDVYNSIVKNVRLNP